MLWVLIELYQIRVDKIVENYCHHFLETVLTETQEEFRKFNVHHSFQYIVGYSEV